MTDYFYSLFKRQNEILEKINNNIERLRLELTINEDINSDCNGWIFLTTDEKRHYNAPGIEYENYEYVLVKLNDHMGHTLPDMFRKIKFTTN